MLSSESSRSRGKKSRVHWVKQEEVDTIMGTSKNGAVLKLRSRVGVLLQRVGGILWSWGHVGRWLSSPSLRNAQSLSVQSKLTYSPYVLVFLPLCVCVCLGLYVCVLSFYVIAHSPHSRVQPKITCLFCVSMCQTLYVRVNVYKSHLLLLGKFEYGGGPIFKVVLEC